MFSPVWSLERESIDCETQAIREALIAPIIIHSSNEKNLAGKLFLWVRRTWGCSFHGYTCYNSEARNPPPKCQDQVLCIIASTMGE